MSKMKVGVIGCGAIASIYIHNIKYHFDNSYLNDYLITLRCKNRNN